MRKLFRHTEKWIELNRQGDEAILENAKHHINLLAIDGIGPTIRRWNEQRPAHLPSGNVLRKKLNIPTWMDMLKMSGLKCPRNGARKGVAYSFKTDEEVNEEMNSMEAECVPEDWKTRPMRIVYNANDYYYDRRWNGSRFCWEIVTVYRGGRFD